MKEVVAQTFPELKEFGFTDSRVGATAKDFAHTNKA